MTGGSVWPQLQQNAHKATNTKTQHSVGGQLPLNEKPLLICNAHINLVWFTQNKS